MIEVSSKFEEGKAADPTKMPHSLTPAPAATKGQAELALAFSL